MTSYDAVVIGGGHNGLVTAAYLARGGLRVLVLERRPVLGGAAATEELWPGYRVSTAAYLCGLLAPRVIADLDLERHGYRIFPKDPAFFSPFPDGRALFVWRDDRRTAEEISRFSRRDAERYPEYEALLERLAAFVEPWLLRTPPDLVRRRLGDLAGLARLGWDLLRLPPRDLAQAVRIATQSARDFLDAWFESSELKASLATDGVIGARGGPSTPGTAYVLFHHCMGQAAGKRGLWGFVRGGMGGLSAAIAAAARERGAEIRTGAEVERVLVREGRAEGVVLRGGEEIRARIVASSADPKVTFLRLAPDVDAEFRREIEAIRTAGVAMKINLALDGLPSFTACPGEAPGPQHRATIHIGPSMAYIDRAWQEAQEGRPSGQPFCEVTIPTTYDPELAPPGRHLMNIFVQYAPYHLAHGHWDELKEAVADRAIETIEAYAPGLKDRILHRQVHSPLDLERDFALTGGDIFHGEMTPDRLFFMRPVPGWAGYRTPIRGLYLCGAGAHPGGGVMGAPGHNAARTILGDLRR
ncbi:MAG TPA: NAD(P)/FAD-dependent oxidoreductase [bacterium]|nr:NAD(P)/FAD-dependent oxidoreductase [bacterium]